MWCASMERSFPLKTGETITFRPPVVEDAAACLAYLQAVAAETDFLLMGAESADRVTLEYEEEFLRARIGNPNDLHLVGFIGGEMVTMCNIERSGNPRLHHNAEVAIAIKKAHWGKGIGTLAFALMHEWAQENGVRMLRLSVYETNARAQALYRKMGFVPCGRHADAFFVNGAYTDEILMERRV